MIRFLKLIRENGEIDLLHFIEENNQWKVFEKNESFLVSCNLAFETLNGKLLRKKPLKVELLSDEDNNKMAEKISNSDIAKLIESLKDLSNYSLNEANFRAYFLCFDFWANYRPSKEDYRRYGHLLEDNDSPDYVELADRILENK